MTIGQIPGTPRNYEVDGIVSTIDIQRGVCKVICKDGRMLQNVAWGQAYGGLGRSAFNYSPVPRERVRVRFDQRGNCYIDSSIQAIGFNRTDLTFLGKFQEFDTSYFYRRYNNSASSNSSTAGTSRPIDQIPGDASITQGGGILAVTNSGSIIAKASSLAQIFISKIDDLVRVVARNYQQFSEASKRVQENVSGRVYEYRSWYHTKESSRVDAPEYEEIIGDVAAGDHTKGELVDPTSLPGQNAKLYKRQVNNTGLMRYQEEMTTAGEQVSMSTDAGDNFVTKQHLNDMWSVSIGDGTDSSVVEQKAGYVKVLSTNGSQTASIIFNADGTVVLNAQELTVETTGDMTEIIGGNFTRAVTGNITETCTTRIVSATGSNTITGSPTVIA